MAETAPQTSAARRPLGPGGAHQRLENYANRLERAGEKPGIAEAIRVMLAWRGRVLEARHGPQSGFSEPQDPAIQQPIEGEAS